MSGLERLEKTIFEYELGFAVLETVQKEAQKRGKEMSDILKVGRRDNSLVRATTFFDIYKFNDETRYTGSSPDGSLKNLNLSGIIDYVLEGRNDISSLDAKRGTDGTFDHFPEGERGSLKSREEEANYRQAVFDCRDAVEVLERTYNSARNTIAEAAELSPQHLEERSRAASNLFVAEQAKPEHNHLILATIGAMKDVYKAASAQMAQ